MHVFFHLIDDFTWLCLQWMEEWDLGRDEMAVTKYGITYIYKYLYAINLYYVAGNIYLFHLSYTGSVSLCVVF